MLRMFAEEAAPSIAFLLTCLLVLGNCPMTGNIQMFFLFPSKPISPMFGFIDQYYTHVS